jgi:catechol 2,3-dioxygenase-like lactoylglutathione lyase family enzyme
MPLSYLDHVNLRTQNVARLRDFYCGILGLTEGARPPFAFGGAWLYCGEHAVVHLVEVTEQPAPVGALRLEHFSFAATDFEGFASRLQAAGIEHRLSKLLGTETRQINLHDPDGNRVHIDFPDHLVK